MTPVVDGKANGHKPSGRGRGVFTLFCSATKQKRLSTLKGSLMCSLWYEGVGGRLVNLEEIPMIFVRHVFCENMIYDWLEDGKVFSNAKSFHVLRAIKRKG